MKRAALRRSGCRGAHSGRVDGMCGASRAPFAPSERLSRFEGNRPINADPWLAATASFDEQGVSQIACQDAGARSSTRLPAAAAPSLFRSERENPMGSRCRPGTLPDAALARRKSSFYCMRRASRGEGAEARKDSLCELVQHPIQCLIELLRRFIAAVGDGTANCRNFVDPDSAFGNARSRVGAAGCRRLR